MDNDSKPWKDRVSQNEQKPSWANLELRKRSMKALRLEREIFQSEIADDLGISNARISMIERRGSRQRILNVAEFIKSLGGELKLVAVFDDTPPTEITNFDISRLKEDEKKNAGPQR